MILNICSISLFKKGSIILQWKELYLMRTMILHYKGVGLVKEKLALCANIAFCRVNLHLFSSTYFLEKNRKDTIFKINWILTSNLAKF